MRVLIAGCGYVGSALAAELHEAGHEVFGLRRDISKLPPGIHGISVDLLDPSTMTALPALGPDDALVYCASAGGRTEERYRAMYVDGLRNVLDAVPDVGRAIFTSSTAVYGQRDGEEVDEASTTEPSRFTGRILLEAEALLRERMPGRQATLRLGGIYGPGRTRLVRMVQEGAARIPREPVATNRVHLRDCAGQLHHLLMVSELSPIYVGVDGEAADYGDVLRFIASELGAPEPAMADGDDKGGRLNKRCRPKALLASGYQTRVPGYRDGYPEIVREYLAGPA